MLPEDGMRLVWLVVLVLVIGIVGLAIILGLLASWRNQSRRDQLLRQGERLRTGFRTPPTQPPSNDAWREAGRRYTSPDEAANQGDDPQADPPDPGEKS